MLPRDGTSSQTGEADMLKARACKARSVLRRRLQGAGLTSEARRA
jgi:uncharacterized protein